MPTRRRDADDSVRDAPVDPPRYVVLDPRIPYVTPPELPVLPSLGDGRPTPEPFGALVGIGVFLGWRVASQQARRLETRDGPR